jgi:hypothetical protein
LEKLCGHIVMLLTTSSFLQNSPLVKPLPSIDRPLSPKARKNPNLLTAKTVILRFTIDN